MGSIYAYFASTGTFIPCAAPYSLLRPACASASASHGPNVFLYQLGAVSLRGDRFSSLPTCALLHGILRIELTGWSARRVQS